MVVLEAHIVINREGLVREWNRGAEAIFGYARDEAVGQELATLIIPERYRARHRAALHAIREGAAPRLIGRPLDLFGITKKGEEIPVRIIIRGVSADGSFTASILERHEDFIDVTNTGERGLVKTLTHTKEGFMAVIFILGIGLSVGLWLKGIVVTPEQIEVNTAAIVLVADSLVALKGRFVVVESRSQETYNLLLDVVCNDPASAILNRRECARWLREQSR